MCASVRDESVLCASSELRSIDLDPKVSISLSSRTSSSDNRGTGTRRTMFAMSGGSGDAMATTNDGGESRSPPSSPSLTPSSSIGGKKSRSPSRGVGGGRSAYDTGTLTSADDINGEPLGSGPIYGGGATGIVPGKNLGTNGAGPCIGGPSSDAYVWKDSASECKLRDERS